MIEKIRSKNGQKLYLTLYLLNLLLGGCLLYNAVCPVIIRKGIGLLIMIWGLFLASLNVLLTVKDHKKIDSSFVCLFGLLFCMAATALINFKYGISSAVKICVWSTILFFVVFPFFMQVEKDHIVEEITEIIFPALMLWMAMEIISVAQFLLQITYFVKLPEYPIAKAQGVYYNRLFGIFVDCSLSSTISWNLLVLGFLTGSLMKGKRKILIVLSVILNWVYIVLSGGRSALVIAAIALTILGWVCLFRYVIKKSVLLSLLLSVFLAVSLVSGGVSTTRSIMISSATTVVTGVRDEALEEEISLERTDLEDKADITNLRTQLWKESLMAYRDHPITGASIDGFIPYMKQKYPDSFVATTGKDVGNGYLAVLVYAGPVAALFMIAFIIFQLKKLVPYFFADLLYGTGSLQQLLLLLVAIDAAVAAMINMDIFYINAADAMLFWLTLGAVNVFSEQNAGGKEQYQKKVVAK